MSEEEKISSAVAFTIITELRDQIKIKDMQIRKLKEKSGKYKDLLQECRETLLTAHSLFLDTISGCTIETILNKLDGIDDVIYEQLTKTDEVLRCGNDL